MTNATACKHLGYRMTEGDLCCTDCGEISRSPKWRGNVYGVSSPEAKMEHGAIEDKREHQPIENKGHIAEPEHRRVGRPSKSG